MISLRTITSVITKPETDIPLFNDISIDFPSAHISVITGVSGAGKTTLLRIIAHLEGIISGTIIIDGKEVQNIEEQQRAQCIGFVFQNLNLFPHLTALENCVQPLVITKNMSRETAEKQSLIILEQLGIASLQNRYPYQLSGGQKQRVAISRALVLGPKILLLDEPTSALDPQNTFALVRLLKELSSRGITIIVASHDVDFVKNVQDVTYTIENGKIDISVDLKKISHI